MKKPLLSVGRMCDEGNRVVFEKGGGYIKHVMSKERVLFE